MKRKLKTKPSDFYLVVGDTRFGASKALLSEKSPVFNAMFESEMNETLTNELIITDFSKEVVECFLICLGNVVIERSDVIRRNPRELLAISNKYQVFSLVQEIEQHLLITLGIDNSLSLLQFADMFSLNSLRKAAIKIVALNVSFLSSRTNLIETLGQELFVDLMTYMQENLNPNLTDECTSNIANSANYKVVVSDCGIPEVNGTYHYLGLFNSGGFYTKATYYKGSIKRMIILKHTSYLNNPDKMFWFLACDSCLEEKSVKLEIKHGSEILFVSDEDCGDCSEDTIPYNKPMAGDADVAGIDVPVLKCVRYV